MGSIFVRTEKRNETIKEGRKTVSMPNGPVVQSHERDGNSMMGGS